MVSVQVEVNSVLTGLLVWLLLLFALGIEFVQGMFNAVDDGAWVSNELLVKELLKGTDDDELEIFDGTKFEILET